MDIQKIRKFFEGDRFCLYNGITIDEVNEYYALCSVLVEDRHLNAGNVAQGGLLFTLADFAFAVHANSLGKLTVSSGADIDFVRPAMGKKLIAKAYPVSVGGRTCLYRAEVFDENGIAAFVTVRGFIKGENPALKED